MNYLLLDVSIRLEEPFELFLQASAPVLSRLVWDCTIWPLRKEFHYIKVVNLNENFLVQGNPTKSSGSKKSGRQSILDSGSLRYIRNKDYIGWLITFIILFSFLMLQLFFLEPQSSFRKLAPVIKRNYINFYCQVYFLVSTHG